MAEAELRSIRPVSPTPVEKQDSFWPELVRRGRASSGLGAAPPVGRVFGGHDAGDRCQIHCRVIRPGVEQHDAAGPVLSCDARASPEPAPAMSHRDADPVVSGGQLDHAATARRTIAELNGPTG